MVISGGLSWICLDHFTQTENLLVSLCALCHRYWLDHESPSYTALTFLTHISTDAEGSCCAFTSLLQSRTSQLWASQLWASLLWWPFHSRTYPIARKLLRNFYLMGCFATFLCPLWYSTVLSAVSSPLATRVLQIAVLSALAQSAPLHSLLSQDVPLATGLSFLASFAALLRIHSS